MTLLGCDPVELVMWLGLGSDNRQGQWTVCHMALRSWRRKKPSLLVLPNSIVCTWRTEPLFRQSFVKCMDCRVLRRAVYVVQWILPIMERQETENLLAVCRFLLAVWIIGVPEPQGRKGFPQKKVLSLFHVPFKTSFNVFVYRPIFGSPDSKGGIATWYVLDGRKLESWQKQNIYSLLHRPDNLCYPLKLLLKGFWISFPGVKRPRRDVSKLPPWAELRLYSAYMSSRSR